MQVLSYQQCTLRPAAPPATIVTAWVFIAIGLVALLNCFAHPGASVICFLACCLFTGIGGGVLCRQQWARRLIIPLLILAAILCGLGYFVSVALLCFVCMTSGHSIAFTILAALASIALEALTIYLCFEFKRFETIRWFEASSHELQ